jgi:hypothetical protein
MHAHINTLHDALPLAHDKNLFAIPLGLSPAPFQILLRLPAPSLAPHHGTSSSTYTPRRDLDVVFPHTPHLDPSRALVLDIIPPLSLSRGRRPICDASSARPQRSRAIEDDGEEWTERWEAGGDDADVELDVVPDGVGIVTGVVGGREDFGLEDCFYDCCGAGAGIVSLGLM